MSDRSERKLTAIMAADVAGYSRLVGQDEEGTVARLKVCMGKALPLIADHGGRVIDTAGDGILAEFPSAIRAIEAATAVQQRTAELNVAVPPDKQLRFRVGVHVGDVMIDGEKLFGDGVNVAARLEQICEPGDIFISGTVYDQLKSAPGQSFEPLGNRKLKNIAALVRVYRLRTNGPERRRPMRWRWWMAGVPATIMIALAAWLAAGYLPGILSPRAAGSIPSVAVLPFKDLSSDKSLGYLGEGVANDLISLLARFADLAVVSRTSSFAYQDKDADVRQIGRDLGVGYVVEGSVRKEADRVRISAQLIDASTGDNVWAERFDKSGTDLWALQDEVTARIVGAMTGEKGAIRLEDYRRAWGKDNENLAEYDFYLRSQSRMNVYTKEGIDQAIEIANDGLKIFPGSPLISVELAWSHFLRFALFFSSDPQADSRRANELVSSVLSGQDLSPQVAKLAHWVNAWLLTLKREHDDALVEIDKALAAAPYDAFTLSDAASIYLQAGQPEKAIALTDAAALRDPGLFWLYNYSRGFALIVLGQNEKAVEVLKTTEFADAPVLLAIAYVRLDRMEEARTAVAKMLKANPIITIQSWLGGYNFRDPTILDRAAADLKVAGLPTTGAAQVEKR